MEQSSGKVLCTAYSKGRKHDFTLFKTSKLSIHDDIEVVADSGYQGIQKLHAKSVTPVKASKYRKLSPNDKISNTALSKKRIKVENVIGFIKRFKIFSTRYRNRRKRFGLRFNLFAAICNLEISKL